MAAGGDFGASVAPQLMGIIVDAVSANSQAAQFAQTLMISPEQLGMKTGMLVASVFPLLGVVLLLSIRRNQNKK